MKGESETCPNACETSLIALETNVTDRLTPWIRAIDLEKCNHLNAPF